MKLKTAKAISKRFRITKRGKIEKRTQGQAHFNTRETGQKGRSKRSDIILSKTLKHVMTVSLPNR